jgi:hypothetical protein
MGGDLAQQSFIRPMAHWLAAAAGCFTPTPAFVTDMTSCNVSNQHCYSRSFGQRVAPPTVTMVNVEGLILSRDSAQIGKLVGAGFRPASADTAREMFSGSSAYRAGWP